LTFGYSRLRGVEPQGGEMERQEHTDEAIAERTHCGRDAVD
jgi:hypothetical protein